MENLKAVLHGVTIGASQALAFTGFMLFVLLCFMLTFGAWALGMAELIHMLGGAMGH